MFVFRHNNNTEQNTQIVDPKYHLLYYCVIQMRNKGRQMGNEVKWVAFLSFITGGTSGAMSGVFYYYKSVLLITVIPVLLLAWNHQTQYTTSLSWGFWMYVCSRISIGQITQRLYAVGVEAIGVDNTEQCWNTFLTVGRLLNFVGVIALWAILIVIQDWHWMFHIIIPTIALALVFLVSSFIAVVVAKPVGLVTKDSIPAGPTPESPTIKPVSEYIQNTTLSTPIKWLSYVFGGLILVCVVIRPFI